MRSHKEWFLKAKSDLGSAKKLIEGCDDDFLDAVVCHTQQSAEKSLKGYLAYKGDKIRKTHDLILLTKLCGEYDQSFDFLLGAAETLTPFSFCFRYPDDVLLPERRDAEQAIILAEQIFNFVESKINDLNIGQKSVF